ncbi:MAG: hypothetical protein AAF907_18385, partial [Planctomycetota bacterium]
LENLGLLYAQQNDRPRAAAALAASGTRLEADAKLAALFPASKPADGYVLSEALPTWAGLASDPAVVPVGGAEPGRSGAGSPVRTAAVGAATGEMSGAWSDATAVQAPPVPPPPRSPAADDDLPAFEGFGPASPTSSVIQTSASAPATTVPADDLPLWPPVGGFSAAN